jgi:hypothetical protein
MTRKLKFGNADDLIDNCKITEGCFVWKPKHGFLIDNPCLSPLSPLAVALQTNSVARLLFITCRFLPASGRLVKWCTTKSCVNPYHFSEGRKIVDYRLKTGERDGTGFFTDLLPEQESIRHLLPPVKVIQQAGPTNPVTVKLLITAAMQAGFDCQKLSASKLQQKISNAHRLKQPDGEPATPALILSSRLTPRRAERTEEEEEALKKESHDFLNQDIFAQIEARKKAKLRKMVDDWDTDAK